MTLDEALSKGFAAMVPEMDADNCRAEITDDGLDFLLDSHLEENAFDFVCDNPPIQNEGYS